MKPIVALTVLAFSLTAPVVPAAHGWQECPAEPFYPYLPPGARDGQSFPAYVAVDTIINDWLPSVWIYAESNGEAGLQRDDGYCHDVDAGGNPYTRATADTIIF